MGWSFCDLVPCVRSDKPPTHNKPNRLLKKKSIFIAQQEFCTKSCAFGIALHNINEPNPLTHRGTEEKSPEEDRSRKKRSLRVESRRREKTEHPRHVQVVVSLVPVCCTLISPFHPLSRSPLLFSLDISFTTTTRIVTTIITTGANTNPSSNSICRPQVHLYLLDCLCPCLTLVSLKKSKYMKYIISI